MFKKQKPVYYAVYSAIIIAGIILDQLTKLLSSKFLSKIDTLPLIDGVLHLTYVENRGAAFGMLANHRWVFITVSTVTILALTVFLFSGKSEKRLYNIPIALIISGGVGNMIDRIFLGYVVDFIDFRLINFAVFNGADSFVCVGAALLILALVLDIIEDGKKKKTGEEK